MIKHSLSPKPQNLTAELQSDLTKEFEKTGKDVWNRKWIRKAVLEKSFGKCCYSDIALEEESKNMEIDHFLPKSIYPHLVVEWNNLNPSCKYCNGKKGSHDSQKEPIVNPFNDNPKDYIYFFAGTYLWKNEIGKKTIEVLGLNDEMLRNPREQIVEFYQFEFEYLFVNRNLFLNPDSKHLEKLKIHLKSGNRKKRYAALVSTFILENINFKQIEIFLKEKALWDEELQSLKSELEFCALPHSTNIYNKLKGKN